MRLYSIGRSDRSQIVLKSGYCGSNHAELLLLDNGDVILTDSSSQNGTFVNGKRIAPHQEVLVSRQDNIMFADEALNWSLVPDVRMPDVKKIICIGSHHRNNCVIQGPAVSRFHATIKQMNNGKWYICDHSTNGTMINGNKVPKDQDYPLTGKDRITCGGQSVINPIPDQKSGNGLIIASVSVVAVIAIAAVLWFSGVFSLSPKRIYANYANSTAAVVTHYYYTVSSEQYGDCSFVVDPQTNEFELFDGENYMISLATGFFISEDGVLITNHHVSEPWKYQDELKEVRRAYRDFYKLSDSDVKEVYGRVLRTAIIPNNSFFDNDNMLKCRNIINSSNKDIDLAIFQTINNKLPEGMTYVPLNKISEETKEVGTSVYTIGFPMIKKFQDIHSIDKASAIQAYGTSGTITQNNEIHSYSINADVTYGSSGSPVFDEKGNLVSVIYAGFTNTQGYNFGIKSKYIKRLLEEAKNQ